VWRRATLQATTNNDCTYYSVWPQILFGLESIFRESVKERLQCVFVDNKGIESLFQRQDLFVRILSFKSAFSQVRKLPYLAEENVKNLSVHLTSVGLNLVRYWYLDFSISSFLRALLQWTLCIEKNLSRSLSVIQSVICPEIEPHILAPKIELNFKFQLRSNA